MKFLKDILELGGFKINKTMTIKELKRKRKETFDELNKINEQIYKLNVDELKNKYIGKYLRITTPTYSDKDAYMYCSNIVKSEIGMLLQGTCFIYSEFHRNASLNFYEIKNEMLFDEKYNNESFKIISKEEFDRKFKLTLNHIQLEVERYIHNQKIGL